MVLQLTTVPEEIANLWSATQKARAEYTAEKCQKRIPNGNAFKETLAGPSSHGFQEFVRPDFISSSGLTAEEIIARQASKLSASYDKFQSGLKHAYGEVEGVLAKRFKERVELRKKAYSEGAARKLLSFTGTRASGLGAVPIAAAWLVGDQKIVGSVRASDSILEGGPSCVVLPQVRPGFKSALNQRLIQAGAAIIDANYDPGIIKGQNDLTNDLVQGMVNKTLNLADFQTGGDSCADYGLPEEQAGAIMYLEIKVSQG